jgi:uncharacterized membrane protein YphA (DoxX/SURF4 family)
MKSTNLLYWIITCLFSAFMLFSSVPSILSTPESLQFMRHLGYPDYIVPFIGIAKVLGIIAILIPGFPRIKEWAYAGLFFDLAGAAYSVASREGLSVSILFIVLPAGFLFASYFLYHKRRKSSEYASHLNMSVNRQEH